MKRLFASLSLAPLLLAPGEAGADTLEDALTAAYRNNPNLEDARLAVRSAREDSVQAFAGYLPSVGLTGSYGIRNVEVASTSIFGPTNTQHELEPLTASLQLQQQLYTGGRRDGQRDLARASVEGARHGLRATEQDVLLAAVDAYLSVRRDAEVLRLRREHVSGLERQLTGTQRRLEVGEVSRTDVAQTRTRLSGARAAAARAEADLETSRARYELVVGKAAETLAPVETPHAPGSLDEAVREAEERHPQILRSVSARRAARAQVEIERSALRPQVSFVGRYDHFEDSSIEDDRSDGASAVAQLSLPLFEGGFARSRLRQGRINVRRAEAQIEGQRREVVANVVSAWNNLEAGRDVMQSAREQVEAASQAVEGAERERGLGLRTTIDVLNAEEERRNAQIGLVSAEAEANFAAYALLAATGVLTIETLDVKE
ncbi:MAG: TolC family outer membrane protein [Vitreimonas sp.]